jgi:uncharacterized protein
MQANSSTSDKRKLLSAVAHGSIFISALLVSIAIPIGIYFVSDDSVVQDNAKEAINFHLNVWLIGAVIGILSFLTFGLVGFVLAPIWFIYHWVFSVLAIAYCWKQPNTVYRYPFTFHLM